VERPQDVLRVGQVVKAKVLDVDKEKRQIKLSMKQLVPTGLDEYIAEHKEGDVVTGRLIEVSGADATVELGEGIRSRCRVAAAAPAKEEQAASAGKVDLSAFSSMLKERWKSGPVSAAKTDEVRAGQVRSFRITKLDRDAKTIAVEMV
jgi:small subunit ribosomal protein S1